VAGEVTCFCCKGALYSGTFYTALLLEEFRPCVPARSMFASLQTSSHLVNKGRSRSAQCTCTASNLEQLKVG
jgi:hypothetical protein